MNVSSIEEVIDLALSSNPQANPKVIYEQLTHQVSCYLNVNVTRTVEQNEAETSFVLDNVWPVVSWDGGL